MRIDVIVMQSLENLHQSRRRVNNNDVEQMRFQKDLNAARHRLRLTDNEMRNATRRLQAFKQLTSCAGHEDLDHQVADSGMKRVGNTSLQNGVSCSSETSATDVICESTNKSLKFDGRLLNSSRTINGLTNVGTVVQLSRDKCDVRVRVVDGVTCDSAEAKHTKATELCDVAETRSATCDGVVSRTCRSGDRNERRWSTSSTSLDSLLSEAVAEYSQNVRSAPCDNLSSSKTSNAVELAITQPHVSTVPSNHPPCAADSHETSTSFNGLVQYSGDISCLSPKPASSGGVGCHRNSPNDENDVSTLPQQQQQLSDSDSGCPSSPQVTRLPRPVAGVNPTVGSIRVDVNAQSTGTTKRHSSDSGNGSSESKLVGRPPPSVRHCPTKSASLNYGSKLASVCNSDQRQANDLGMHVPKESPMESGRSRQMTIRPVGTSVAERGDTGSGGSSGLNTRARPPVPLRTTSALSSSSLTTKIIGGLTRIARPVESRDPGSDFRPKKPPRLLSKSGVSG